MAVLCTRVILLECKAVFGSRKGASGSRERNLVDQVMKAKAGRESWEGDDNESRRAIAETRDLNLDEDSSTKPKPPPRVSSDLDEKQTSEESTGASPFDSSAHRAIEMTSTEPCSSSLGKYPETIRPSTLSFQSPSNLKSVSRVFPREEDNSSIPQPQSTILLIPTVGIQEVEIEESPSKNLKERFSTSVNRIRRSHSSNSRAELNTGRASSDFPSFLRVPSSSVETRQIRRSRSGGKLSHSRNSSAGSELSRTYDPSQMSEANRALAVRMAGLDLSPKRELTEREVLEDVHANTEQELESGQDASKTALDSSLQISGT